MFKQVEWGDNVQQANFYLYLNSFLLHIRFRIIVNVIICFVIFFFYRYYLQTIVFNIFVASVMSERGLVIQDSNNL
jgi:hypothetical protein